VGWWYLGDEISSPKYHHTYCIVSLQVL